MKVTGSAVSLTVADPEASARFLEQTFGFEREMAADGFVSLTRPDVGFNVIYLRAGCPPSGRATALLAPPTACSSCWSSTTSTPSTGA
jgi:catechol 2,3-dioxygenase-like lactoylglutathione lyase family enzyme